MELKNIPLSKIDPKAIDETNIRIDDVNKGSEGVNKEIYIKSIKDSNLIDPIKVRKLTPIEKKNVAKEGAEYGIISGHQRYNAYVELYRDEHEKDLNNLNYETIQCIIDDSDNTKNKTPEERKHEIMMGIIANLTRTDMTTLEKGKAYYKILENDDSDLSYRKLEDVTGDKKSSINRWVTEYKAYANIPMTTEKKNITKPAVIQYKNIKLPKLDKTYTTPKEVSADIDNLKEIRKSILLKMQELEKKKKTLEEQSIN